MCNEMQNAMIEMLQLNTLSNSHEHMVTWTFFGTYQIDILFKHGD